MIAYDAIRYRTPTGPKLNCKGWVQEAALRMLLNNLDPAVAERPEELIVYGGRGKAARNFEALELIIKALKDLEEDETLLIQSGKPVGILRTHKDAPRVLLSNSQLVPKWADWAHFDELEKKGLIVREPNMSRAIMLATENADGHGLPLAGQIAAGVLHEAVAQKMAEQVVARATAAGTQHR